MRRVADDVAWLGYSRVNLKALHEPAIVEVLKETVQAICIDGVDQALEEHPPP